MRISVICPVYNVEKYLPRCVESLLAQSFTDFELLLVDDGSTDGSGALCDAYAGKDARVRVFHKQNGGLSDARNFGLDRVSGECVCFVDSDDYVGREYLRILWEALDENVADISAVAVTETFSEGMTFVASIDTRERFDREAAFRKTLTDTGVSAWAKLYRLALFDGVRYPVGEVYEDLATTPWVVDRCRKLVTSTSIQYYYFQRAGSLSYTVKDDTVQTWVRTTDRVQAFTGEVHPALLPYAQAQLTKSLFWFILERMLAGPSYIGWAKQLKRHYRSVLQKAWRLPALTFKERCKVTLFMISVRLFRVIRLPMLKRRETKREAR